MTCTGVSAVGNQGDVGEFRAHDCSGGFKLLGHAGSALGAFVADHDDDVFAMGDAAGVEGGVEFVFFVEDLWVVLDYDLKVCVGGKG